MKTYNLMKTLTESPIFKDNERLEFEHIHMDHRLNEMYCGPENKCPISSCVYTRWRNEQMLKRDLENYNGG